MEKHLAQLSDPRQNQLSKNFGGGAYSHCSQEPAHAGHAGGDSSLLPTSVFPARLHLHCLHHAYSWLLAAAKILFQYYFPLDSKGEKKKQNNNQTTTI